MKNFIRQFGLVVFGVLFFGAMFSLNVSAASFTDVNKEHSNYDAVEYLKEKGVVEGYKDGTFGPEKEIKRSEAIKIIVKAFNLASNGTYEEVFPDVKKDNWFFPFVMAGEEAGFIQGYDDGTFKPTQQVKLSETLKMALGAGEADIPKEVEDDVFVDVENDNWLAPYAYYAREHNIVLANKEGLIAPAKVMTRGSFAEIVYRTMTVLKNDGKVFPIYKKWTTYKGTDLPFEMKYNSETWEVIKNPLNVVFFNSDEGNYQFSSSRIYPNSAKVEISIDRNDAKYPVETYFSNIKELFPDAKYTEFTWDKFKALEVLYSDERIVDWYIYLDEGYVLAVYTQYGDGVEGYRFPQLIQAMLSTLKYHEVSLNFNQNYEELLSVIFENILVEDKGMDMLNTLPDKKIIETDAIGVGTGPVDYYYSEGVNHTFKYERESDVILDKRQGETTEF